MPYKAEVRTDCVLIRHEGEINPEEAAAASAEALQLTRQHRLPRVVVDIRDVSGEPGQQDLRSFMQSNAEVAPPRPHAAIIVREDQYPHFRLIEDFAVSRGMPIRIFLDEEEAISWFAD